MAFLDDDDYWDKKYLERVCEELERGINFTVCYSYKVDHEGKLFPGKETPFRIQSGRPLFDQSRR